MSKGKKGTTSRRMRQEYDFSDGVRGKYATRYARGSNVVLLERDVARLFPDSDSVNRALRALAAVAPRQPRRERK